MSVFSKILLALLFFYQNGLSISFAKDKAHFSKKEKVNQLYKKWTKDFRDLPELSISEFKRISAISPQKIVLVDVREKNEQDVSKIPGSIPQGQFLKDITQYRGKTIVAYCTIGYRSGKFAMKLRNKYKMDARNLTGSLLGWIHEGGQLINSKGRPTKKVHVYGKDWNFVPDSYEPTW